MQIPTTISRSLLWAFVLLSAFALTATQAIATADYKSTPEFTGTWTVPHVSDEAPLLYIDATDDDEVHVLNFHDQTLFEYEDDGELEDAWQDFNCVEFDSVRNMAIDHKENVFVLEAGTTNKLHRFSEDYFEDYCEEDEDDEDGIDPESLDEDEEEREEDEEDGDEDEDEDENDLADVLSWDIDNGIDVAGTSGHAFVISSNTLTRIELETGAMKAVPMNNNVAVSTGRLGNVYVLTEGGTVLKKFSNGLSELSSKKLASTSVDMDVDRRGNVYLARSDGYIKQYNRKFGLINALKLPDGALPSQITISHDGDLFVAGKDSAVIYHYNYRDIPEPRKKDKAIYRFWSKLFNGHFYSASYDEARSVSDTDDNWEYEGVAYKYVSEDEAGAAGVFRFWSNKYKHHFYTSSEQEKDSLMENDPNWSFEGEVYNVYSSEQPGSIPTYRFWSDVYKGHFYTTNQEEKEYIEANDRNWTYEGIAWWAVEGA